MDELQMGTAESQTNLLLTRLSSIEACQARMESLVTAIHDGLANRQTEKEWYSTTELAEAMGKSRYTVQERWCNDGRIECEKDPESGRWRIPGAEYRRLLAGGGLRPKFP